MVLTPRLATLRALADDLCGRCLSGLHVHAAIEHKVRAAEAAKASRYLWMPPSNW
eukprot:CAMPEP_0178394582 /NCGR_PEP_ID=MMETSP0689_2-20121128/12782_1 /TAXON_ID=160604 /ORGANISM="Amphidinium massartii, Strain CS-259" /LENGTH=54 /DNA_ID=CAMNT_0020015219 /DNA_START=482 /DNA_END=643 /DNA_ORIENTATION=-